ncbi:hypothetical protein OIE71_00120 [Streptomyces sp. NBC_01725]|uniref:hypothetical protein n=1 Tax=Streptomyces sp. NBC_01725 TaxID=2975923 RepID=UPI002E2BB01F|nr:hypothetical protein [Streptomyces sp. NBC_01725]
MPGSFEDAVRRYASLAPPLDATKLQSLSESQAPWNDFLDQAERNSANGFMIFWKVQEPIGNHTIAQRMFHYDASVMLRATPAY